MHVRQPLKSIIIVTVVIILIVCILQYAQIFFFQCFFLFYILDFFEKYEKWLDRLVRSSHALRFHDPGLGHDPPPKPVLCIGRKRRSLLWRTKSCRHVTLVLQSKITIREITCREITNTYLHIPIDTVWKLYTCTRQRNMCFVCMSRSYLIQTVSYVMWSL